MRCRLFSLQSKLARCCPPLPRRTNVRNRWGINLRAHHVVSELARWGRERRGSRGATAAVILTAKQKEIREKQNEKKRSKKKDSDDRDVAARGWGRGREGGEQTGRRSALREINSKMSRVYGGGCVVQWLLRWCLEYDTRAKPRASYARHESRATRTDPGV